MFPNLFFVPQPLMAMCTCVDASPLENAEDVLVMIGCLLSNHTDLNDQELVTILNKLSAVVNVSTVTPALGKVIMEILSDILESDSNFQPVTNKYV